MVLDLNSARGRLMLVHLLNGTMGFSLSFFFFP